MVTQYTEEFESKTWTRQDPVSGEITWWRWDAWRLGFYQVWPTLPPMVSFTQQAGAESSVTRWLPPRW